MGPTGVFGGTFDPIHYGHLRTALELAQGLALEEVRFVPCAMPPHREQPQADAALRLAMVRAAVEDAPGFVVDERELERDGPSYSVDTLSELRAEWPERPLCLLLGMDAFLGLPQWHRWTELLELAHVVVAHRPGWQVPRQGVLGETFVRHRATQPAELHASTGGRIYVQAVTQLDISSTELRERIRTGFDVRYLLPDRVRELIAETECYASTTPRQANA